MAGERKSATIASNSRYEILEKQWFLTMTKLWMSLRIVWHRHSCLCVSLIEEACTGRSAGATRLGWKPNILISSLFLVGAFRTTASLPHPTVLNPAFSEQSAMTPDTRD